MQDEQFKAEIKNLEAMQQSAYDQLRFHRFVCSTSEIEKLNAGDKYKVAIDGYELRF